MSDIKGLLNISCKGKEGETSGPLQGVKLLSLYFSAHWCPPCRGFTPVLSDCYKAVNKDCKQWEIVFVSLDRSEQDYEAYFAEMPWLAALYSENREDLAGTYGVSGIPALINLSVEDGKVINSDGRGLVQADKEGKKFPW